MTNAQNKIQYINVSWNKLTQQLPYKLIQDYEVPQSEILSKWSRMRETGSNINNFTNLKKLRDDSLFNVVCKHQDCQSKASWENRYNLLNFKTKHWVKQHKQKEDVQIAAKIVSFWSTNEEKTWRQDEYRLVDVNTLEYIRPKQKRSFDAAMSQNIDINMDNNNTHQTDWDNNSQPVNKRRRLSAAVNETNVVQFATSDSFNIEKALEKLFIELSSIREQINKISKSVSNIPEIQTEVENIQEAIRSISHGEAIVSCNEKNIKKKTN
eukprot:459059_1